MPDIPKLDDGIELRAGVSPEGMPYVMAVVVVDGQEMSIPQMIPEYTIRMFNYAARRAKNPAYRGQG